MKENSIIEKIVHDYTVEKKSVGRLIKETGMTRYTIDKILKDSNIPKNEDLNDNKKALVIKNLTLEEFQDMYVNKNMSYSEMSKKLGCTERQLKRLNASKFHLSKKKEDIVNNRRKTFESKYGEGIIAARQVKEIQDSINQRYFEKHGVYNPSQNKEVQQKRISTYIEREGYKNPFENPKIKEKIKKHYQEKYGEDIINPSQVPSINQRVTRLNRYAQSLNANHTKEEIDIVDSADNLLEYINSLQEDQRNITTIAKLLHYDDHTIGKYIHKYKLEEHISFHQSSSSYEYEIIDFIENTLHIKNIQKNIKGLLPNKLQEIDIYLPDYKFGIEFNGSYWHSEEYKQHNYHQEKTLNALKNDITLYNIFEYEWTSPDMKEKIKKMIEMRLIGYNHYIYGRNTKVVELNISDKKEFLEKYHLQGNDASNIFIGLEDIKTGELLSVATFCKPRFTKGYSWELSRFCNKFEVQVVGGASKLLKYFVDKFCKDGETIITYNDIGKTHGNVYSKIGFERIRISKPSYVWWKSHSDIKTRYQCQMKDEISTMHELGYRRIFECGNGVWVYKVKK